MFSVQIELTDPSLSFLSQFWRRLCLPLGLASPIFLCPYLWLPAHHLIVTQSRTCGVSSPKCASPCAGMGSGRLPRELFSCGSWWFSSHLWTSVAWFNPLQSFWSFSQLLKSICDLSYSIFSDLSPSVPCTGLHCFSIILVFRSTASCYSVPWSLSIWRVSA